MKPSTPKGTRDFLPAVVQRRNYIFDTIKEVFEQYGYQPIETPAMENLETLTGKYGEEGDRLIFKILESGESAKEIFNNIRNRSSEFKILDRYKDYSLPFGDIAFETLWGGISVKEEMDEIIYRLIQKLTIEFPPESEFDKARIRLLALSFQGFFESKSVIKVGDDLKAREQISFFEHLCEKYKSENSEDFRSYLNELITYFINSYDSGTLLIGLFDELESKNLTASVTKKALRYDLTVPFARFVVQHQNDLAFPFRRYQIQPVWRADRPQKGRYREFFQCDADVIGTDSLRCEVEIVQMLDNVFSKLGLPVAIKINNRKLLTALAAYVGEADKLIQLTTAIDKLDKIPLDKVIAELDTQGFSAEAQTKLKTVLEAANNISDNDELLQKMEIIFAGNAAGEKGIEELRYIFTKVKKLGLETAQLRLGISLARGLNYYTGAIFEVVPLTDEQVGSISGGGRYDDLTGVFGMKGMSGVGISFGADRIYDLLEARNGFPTDQISGSELFFVNFGEEEADYCHALMGSIRKAGIRTELYPDGAKLKKQMKYANDRQIPFVAMVGEDELKDGTVTLKNMTTGEQQTIAKDQIIKIIRPK